MMRVVYSTCRLQSIGPGAVTAQVLIVCLAIAVSLSLAGCEPPREQSASNRPRHASTKQGMTELRGETMGTTYSIKLVAAGANDPHVVQKQVDQLLAEINQQMSTYLPSSELSRFNQAPADVWFDVSPETAHVVGQALRFYDETGGALDVTVGPLLRLWKFGPGGRRIGAQVAEPSPEAIADARELVGAALVEVRHDPPALKKHATGVEIDLSAIAKGYAVDAVTELLQGRGVSDCMVEIGGELRAAGRRGDGGAWRIGVEGPSSGARRLSMSVPLRDLAMATSGDYRNFRSSDGKLVSHVIDPRTGEPLPRRGMAVTVVAETCLEADALATSLLVLGPDEGYDWCKESSVAAMFQTLGPISSQTEQRATPAFEALLASDNAAGQSGEAGHLNDQRPAPAKGISSPD